MLRYYDDGKGKETSIEVCHDTLYYVDSGYGATIEEATADYENNINLLINQLNDFKKNELNPEKIKKCSRLW